MNRIDPNSRDSEIDLNISANTDLPRSQINADIIPTNLNEPTEPNRMKSEEKVSYDKCGRGETQMDGLKTRMDYLDIRLEALKNLCLLKRTERNCC